MKPQIKISSLLLILLLTTFFLYQKSLDHAFTNWDDPGYTYDNSLLTQSDPDEIFSVSSLNKIFDKEKTVMLHYHPLTVLSLGIDYKTGYQREKTNSEDIHIHAKPFHRTNILLHLMNTLLVFFFVYQLFRRNIMVAFISALLFSIHPMHVEAVAWISARKELLYTMFLLISLTLYIGYINSLKKRAYLSGTIIYILVFCFYYLSLVSKGSAVILPFLLLLIDYFNQRINFKKWPLIGRLSRGESHASPVLWIVDKTPFIAMSLYFGLLAIETQSGGAVAKGDTFSVFTKILIASYSWVNYLLKVFVPVNLSAFYPYPGFLLDKSISIPVSFYIPFILFLVINGLIIYLLIKKSKYHLPKVTVFGYLFFLFSIIFFLQFISVGQVIMANRYSYLSYTGIFIIIGAFSNHFINKSNVIKYITFSVLGFFSVFCICITSERISVWKDSETLWTDVIEKYPQKVAVAYKNRGKYFALRKNDINKALKDYNVLQQIIKERTQKGIEYEEAAKVYTNLGNIYAMKAGQLKEKAIELQKNKESQEKIQTLVSQYKKHINTSNNMFDKAIQYDSLHIDAYMNKAYNMAKTMRYNEAAELFNRAYNIKPEQLKNNPDLYFFRGIADFSKQNFESAISNFHKCIRLAPQKKEAYYNLSVTYYKSGNREQAINYLNKAKQKGYNVPESYESLVRSFD